MPEDAALIRDVVTAVQPDAIAIEAAPHHLKSYTAIAKALEPLLSHLLSPPHPSGPAAARACLSQAQREAWQVTLLDACRGASFKPDPEQLGQLFWLGSLPFIEGLVPAHIVRTGATAPASAAAAAPSSSPAAAAASAPQVFPQWLPKLQLPVSAQQGRQPMLLVSCGLSREARAKAPAPSLFLGREFDVYLEEVQAALGEELVLELEAWRTVLGDRLEAAGGGRQLATLLATWEAQCCLGPEQQAAVAARVEARMREEDGAAGEAGGAAGAAADGSVGSDSAAGAVGTAGKGAEGVALEMVRTPADPWVAARLAELAAGKDVVRKCRRIVALVGRVHLLSVEEELGRLAVVQ